MSFPTEPYTLRGYPEPPNELESVLFIKMKYNWNRDQDVIDEDKSYWGGIGEAELCEPALAAEGTKE